MNIITKLDAEKFVKKHVTKVGILRFALAQPVTKVWNYCNGFDCLIGNFLNHLGVENYCVYGSSIGFYINGQSLRIPIPSSIDKALDALRYDKSYEKENFKITQPNVVKFFGRHR